MRPVFTDERQVAPPAGRDRMRGRKATHWRPTYMPGVPKRARPIVETWDGPSRAAEKQAWRRASE